MLELLLFIHLLLGFLAAVHATHRVARRTPVSGSIYSPRRLNRLIWRERVRFPLRVLGGIISAVLEMRYVLSGVHTSGAIHPYSKAFRWVLEETRQGKKHAS